MSSQRSKQCLFCLFRASSPKPSRLSSIRPFHTIPPNRARRRPRHRSIKAEELGLIQERLSDQVSKLQPYTADEKALLSQRYTRAQLSAIDTAEASIDPHDLLTQGHVRTDSFRLPYIDDLAHIQPVLDKSGVPESPPLPKMPDPNLRYLKEDEGDDPHMLRLQQQTNLTADQIRRLRVKNLVAHRVVNQTRMGKIQSLYYLTVAGNGNGLLGIGEGKSTEPEDARRQAMMQAVRNMKPILRYESRTIFGEVKAKVGGTAVELSARRPGFGVRTQAKIFEMARCAGISDLAARVLRARNPMNTVKATFEALLSQRLPEEIARARGKKLVDVRKVYYGGKVG